MKVRKEKSAVAKRIGIAARKGTHDARRSAEFLLAEIAKDPRNNDHLVASFVAALCMGVEGEINDCLVEHFFWKIGPAYREAIRPLLMLNIRDRFRTAVLLGSEYRFVLNMQHPRIQEMFSLFELRNRLVHVKHHRKMANVFDFGTPLERIEYENPDPTDPYGPEYGGTISVEDLRGHLTLFNYLIPRFYELGTRLKRKNFNPQGLFVPASKEKKSG